MPNTPKNYGLRPEPKLRAKDWRFGSVSSADKRVLKKDGDYTEYLPKFEQQIGIYFDTMACVSFSALNCLEIIFRANEWKDVDFSDRFTAKMSGTTREGNYLSAVAESIRKDGVVDDELWDWEPRQRNPIFTWDTFYKEIPNEVKMAGKRWLDDWKVRWEWVPIYELEKAMKYGPIQVTVFAWNKDRDGIYPNPKNKYRNHAVTLVGYEKGEHWIIFDHYEQATKKLAWDYEFGHALRYSIEPNKQLPTNPMKLEDDILVQNVEGDGAFALHLDGKLIVGDEGQLLATWLMRNDGDVEGKTKPLPKSEWDKFERQDLKGDPV